MNQENEVNKLTRIEIGDISQFILTRGNDSRKPVILFLHGGPGTAQIGFMPKYQKELEKEYIIANWDQRGSGLSYSDNINKNSMNIIQFVSDAIEVTHYLRKQFKKEKIFLIGHSWGSILGMKMIYEFPELFMAYIGIGQVVDMNKGESIVYDFVYETSINTNNIKALKEIKQIEKPPYKNPLKSIGIIRKWVNEYDGVMKNSDFGSIVSEGMSNSIYYRNNDIDKWVKGSEYSVVNLLEEMLNVNLFKEIKKVKVPVSFFAGRYDYTTPSTIALDYFKVLEAPKKDFVLFEKSAHLPMIEEVNKFYDEVKKAFKK